MLDQQSVTDWHVTAYPDATLEHVALKFAEESGEVIRAIDRLIHGRGDDQALADEMGDAVICLLRLADMRGIPLDHAVTQRWLDVRQRTGYRAAPSVPDPGDNP